jgi:pimeloyl-ACP methyl ester carboxylesterase
VSGETKMVGGPGPTLACEVIEPPEGEGAAPTLLLLHGNGSHRGIWRNVASHLVGVRAVLLDFRGHGESAHTEPPAYNLADHASDLARVVETLPIPYAIAAHSAGALAAAHFIATTVGERRLAPPAGFVWIDIDPAVPRAQVDYFRQRAAAVARVSLSVDEVADALQRLYPRIPADRLHSFVEEGLRRVPEGWRTKLDPATYATWDPGDVCPLLARIGCPTLILVGEASAVSSAAGLEALRSGLLRSEVHRIAGASHLLLLAEPIRVAEVIGDFLRRCV